MENYNIYRDIATRTGGDIYIGVVGPVRTGKSTFIKRFMDTLVVPNIANSYDRERARDEMPQSAAGRTVMTTEPKFIPDEAVEIMVADNATLKVKMIDCVGYIVPEALGHIENGEPRMVRTPWSADPIPFEKAAEIGTRKVIADHSTIGVLVTTDGTIGEIPRKSYVEAEKRVVNELKAIGKPFVIVLNSADTDRDDSVKLAYELEENYDVPVALVNCLELDADDIRHIIEMVLLEFPVREISISLPRWTQVLRDDHPLSVSLNDSILKHTADIKRTGDIKDAISAIGENEYTSNARIVNIDLGTGCASAELEFDDELYYRTISELSGFEIDSEERLVTLLCELAGVKKKFDKISPALNDVNERGYGIVMPDIGDLRLEEPEIVRQANGYGVRLKASAPSIHMIKADIETELNPMVGTEQQSEELVKFLLREFEEDPKKIWGSNIFGKTLHELVTEGLHTKLSHMPDDARTKLGETLQRIINEGSGGLICIIL
jgi:stage IV sporulation protein A